MSDVNNNNNNRTLLFKSIINNVIIRRRLFRYGIEMNRILHYDHYHLEWKVIKNTPHLLCQYGTLNQVKQLIECKLEPKYSKYKWFDHIDLNNNSITDDNNNSNNNTDDIRYIPGLRGLLKGAIRGNRLEVIEYIYNRYKTFKDEIMYGLVEYALFKGSLHIAKYMIDQCDLKWHITNGSYDINKLLTETPDILEYYIDLEFKYNGKCRYPFIIAHKASRNGYLHILKRLCQLGYILQEDDMRYGAEHGHLHIVQFIHEHISSNSGNNMYKGWNYSITISLAIKGNHNDIAKYLLNVKPVNQVVEKSVIKDSTDSGNLEMVKYLLENKYSEIDTDIILSATREGDLDLIKYFYQRYTEKCIEADTMKEALNHNQLPIIQYIHQNYPQTIKSKYLLFNGYCNDYPTVVYCLENGLAYYNDILTFLDSQSFMYIIQHSNHSVKYDMEKAIEIAQQDNDMEMMQYLIGQIGNDWNSIYMEWMFRNPCSDESMFQYLLEQVPKRCKEEWDFTNELIDSVNYDLPLSTIKYIIDNFKIDKTRIVSVIGGAVSRNNMDVFIYLLKLYDGDIDSKGFTRIIESETSTDMSNYYMNKEPIYIKYILENYDDGKRLNYKDIIYTILKNYNYYTFKYIKKMLLKTGKYNPNLITLNHISPYHPKLFKYILKHTEKDVEFSNVIEIHRFRNENDYIPYFIIPLYNYYHRMGVRGIELRYDGQFMDVVRFIYFNPIPTLTFNETTFSLPKSIRLLPTFRNDPKWIFFKARNLMIYLNKM